MTSAIITLNIYLSIFVVLESIFTNKSVLVTGHTGFKGTWLSCWLRKLGANVVGISLPTQREPDHFSISGLSSSISDHRFDITDCDSIANAISCFRPDFIFHLAAQAFVSKSFENPLRTWNTNVIGSINLLEALRFCKHDCCAVFITSDKCYLNNEWLWGYRENDILGGVDPYSASKAAAEIAIHSYIKSFFPSDTSPIRIATARAGNVIGGGDWSPSRIVPDCIKAWSKSHPVTLRQPSATRPWQHVLEPLSGYLQLAASLSLTPELHGESFNFGPLDSSDRTVHDLVKRLSSLWPGALFTTSTSSPSFKESNLLKLNCDKSKSLLNWNAVLDFDRTIEMTATWYKQFYADQSSIPLLTDSQIAYYSSYNPSLAF